MESKARHGAVERVPRGLWSSGRDRDPSAAAHRDGVGARYLVFVSGVFYSVVLVLAS